MPETQTPSNEATETGVIRRPIQALLDLPLAFRWESTRRHPYYLAFWSDARNYRRQCSQTSDQIDQAATLMQHAAMAMLGAIGVWGEPVDPATPFEELDGNDLLDPAFLSGAVQPMTFRAMAVAMINALPQADLAAVGAYFMNAGGEEYAIGNADESVHVQKRIAMARLGQISSPALDSYPETPLYYLHLGASQRTIVRDTEELVRHWKRRRNISERRVHTGKLASYLEVWDLREGWTGSGYDRRRDRSLNEIAKELRISRDTTASRYRAAFRMITGHPFRLALWLKLIAPFKVSPLFGNVADELSGPMRQRLLSPVRRPVPETVVAPHEADQRHDVGLVEFESATDTREQRDLLFDLCELLEDGHSDAEIARRLECDVQEIQYLRERYTEFGASSDTRNSPTDNT